MNALKSDTKKDLKQDTRHCLLQAASKLFAALGFAKTSTRDLARESNTNVALISYHFGSKEGLYKELLREFALEVKNSSEVLIEKSQNSEMTLELFKKDIESIVDSMLHLRRKYPEVCVILSREKLEGMPQAKEIHEEIIYPLIQKFYELFRRAQDKNIVRKDIDPALFFIFLSEGLWGFFELTSCDVHVRKDVNNYLEDIPKLKDQILKVFLNGVLV